VAFFESGRIRRSASAGSGPPAGNARWVRPSSATTQLLSLERLGAVGRDVAVDRAANIAPRWPIARVLVDREPSAHTRRWASGHRGLERARGWIAEIGWLLPGM